MNNNAADVDHFTEGSLPERFDSWIKKTLENLIRTEVRSYKRWRVRMAENMVDDMDLCVSYDPFDCGDDFTEIYVGDTPVILENKKLAEALLKMSHKKRKVIEGTVILGVPVRIVAKQLGLDEHTVRSYKYLTLNKLRALMEEEDDE